VVSDGQPATTAIAHQLASEGVPYTTLDLTNANRPIVNAAYLADTVSGVPRAKFQAVVLPNENPFGDPAELAALTAYEAKFGVRQLDAYVYANPAVGLNYPGYAGQLDGTAATVSASGLAGAWNYLRGPVAFEDNAGDVAETYGFPAIPLPDDAVAGSKFEQVLTGPQGTLAGVYTKGGRSELVLTFSYNHNQQQFRLLAHGIISWLTKGIHLGYQRNYFAVHVDDLFLPDARWSIDANCTPGENCAPPPAGQPEVTTPEIRMVPADVTYAVQWQQQQGLTFDILFNGGGSDQEVAEKGSDPLLTAAVANKSKFRWANHTYEHPFLGCVQDYTVFPWRCTTNAAGAVQYVTKAEIVAQITKNKTFASQKGLPIEAGELVTGEHSGMRLIPQQPVDNPNLGPALTQTGVTSLGSDNSRDPAQRKIGSALTVPRHPMNIFFNVAKSAEEVDEYNWIYTSRANGGSGICEDNPATTTCIAPLDPQTGFADKIVPQEARIGLSHILANDPRPHYVHQSNLAEDRIIYPVLDRILADYRGLFAANTPIVNQRMSAIGAQLAREAAWRTALNAGTVTAYTQDGKIVVKAPAGLDVPITAPEGTRKSALLFPPLFGQQYGGERSGYERTALLASTITLVLPAGA
jgi:hypothetical protein